MDQDLKDIIPKKEIYFQNNNYSEDQKTPEKKKIPSYILIIIFIIVIGGFIFGSIVVYNKYIKDQFSPKDIENGNFDENKTIENIDENIIPQTTDVTDKKEDFYLSLSECLEDQFQINTTTTSMFTNIMEIEHNVKIKGYDENNFCVLEISNLDTNLSYELEDVYAFIEDENNLNNVLFQYFFYKIFTGIGGEDELEDVQDLDDLTEEKKQEIIQEAKELALMFNSAINLDGNLSQEEIEELENEMQEEEELLIESLLSIKEECYFQTTEDAISFIDKKIQGSLFPTSMSSSTETIDGEYFSYTENVYQEGVCIQKQPINMTIQ